MLARVLGALVLGVGLATAASAQQYDPNVRLPEIRVTPRPEPETLPPSSTPSRVDTLTGPELTRDRPSVLPDALERLPGVTLQSEQGDRKSTRLNSSHITISYAVFCLKKKNKQARIV